MITLKRDTLSFTFPEIAQEVRTLIERQIQKIASELPPEWDRAELVSAIESNRDFRKLSSTQQAAAQAKLRTWTPIHIEALLREFAFNLSGVNTNAFVELTIKFQRTMRIPNDRKTYALPTGLGQLPLRSIDDFPETAPVSWMKKGGVIVPLHPSEALWIWFSSRYCFAVKVGMGKTNALSGEPWVPNLQTEPQNYFLVPDPSGYENDEVIRRYVRVPLTTSDSADGPVAVSVEPGGIHLHVTPMRAESYYKNEGGFLLPPTIKEFFMKVIFASVISKELAEIDRRHQQWGFERPAAESTETVIEETACQENVKDQYEFSEWDQTQTVRCFVRTCSSIPWRQITGTDFPHPPLTAKDYQEAGIPWFDDYRDDGKPLPENSSITLNRIVRNGSTRRSTEIRQFFD
jgi:hypothetical protein